MPANRWRARGGAGLLIAMGWMALGIGSGQAEEQREEIEPPEPASLWEAGVGSGFKAGTHDWAVSGGLGLGMPVMGTVKRHNWVLGVVHYGWIFTDVVGKGRWYQGNWELAAEVFGGAQYHPDTAYLVGAGPHFRYYFATGHRWVPFFHFGAGATATDIRNGDLSTTFEFNLQGGGGTHIFLSDKLALTLEYRFIHLSNAGIDNPNLGVNNSTFLAGLTWFY